MPGADLGAGAACHSRGVNSMFCCIYFPVTPGDLLRATSWVIRASSINFEAIDHPDSKNALFCTGRRNRCLDCRVGASREAGRRIGGVSGVSGSAGRRVGGVSGVSGVSERFANSELRTPNSDAPTRRHADPPIRFPIAPEVTIEKCYSLLLCMLKLSYITSVSANFPCCAF
jgi:hypothetical protein